MSLPSFGQRGRSWSATCRQAWRAASWPGCRKAWRSAAAAMDCWALPTWASALRIQWTRGLLKKGLRWVREAMPCGAAKARTTAAWAGHAQAGFFQQVHAAPLPSGVEHAGDRRLQPFVGVGDDQLHAL